MITPVLGIAENDANALVGAYRDWNVADAGFYRDEFGATSSGRWTNGAATIALPRIKADTLEIDLAIPGKEPRPVKVTLDGKVLHDSSLAGATRLTFRLPALSNSSGGRELQISSPPYNPKAAGESRDDRSLGAWIAAVRQFESATPRIGPESGNAAFRSRITAIGAPFIPSLLIDSKAQAPRITIAVANVGNSVWPAGTDVQPGEEPVVLGLVWRRRGESAAVMEQRAPLAFGLFPGERVLMMPELDPHRPDGTVLPPGDYVVELDLLQEHLSWFAPRGGSAARLDVTVTGGPEASR